MTLDIQQITRIQSALTVLAASNSANPNTLNASIQLVGGVLIEGKPADPSDSAQTPAIMAALQSAVDQLASRLAVL